MFSADTSSDDSPQRTTLEQVLACLEDINCVQRFGDFAIDPQATMATDPTAVKRACVELRPDYELRFEERYVDPDAFATKALPDFMASALERLFVSLMDYAYSCHDDRVMPEITCWNLSPHAYAELNHHSVRVFTGKWQADLESECMVIQSRHGLLFAPFDIAQHWADEMALANAQATVMAEAR